MKHLRAVSSFAAGLLSCFTQQSQAHIYWWQREPQQTEKTVERGDSTTKSLAITTPLLSGTWSGRYGLDEGAPLETEGMRSPCIHPQMHSMSFLTLCSKEEHVVASRKDENKKKVAKVSRPLLEDEEMAGCKRKKK
ncbi:MAG: hypothetical protein BYD32DRAFT_421648 [Podila humilis]|nr:MAG: hypothetical protein BYD32DRAFT_421648 [Podila humilis]